MYSDVLVKKIFPPVIQTGWEDFIKAKEMRKERFVKKEIKKLPNSVETSDAGIVVQKYSGDFFRIIVRPAQPQEWTLLLTGKGRETVELKFSDEVLEFTVLVDKAEIIAFDSLRFLLDAELKYSICPLDVERTIYRFFEFSDSGPLADRFLYSRVTDLLIALESVRRSGDLNFSSHDLEVVKEACKLIDEHLATPISIQQLCRKLGLPSYTLQAAFKKHLNNTIGEYTKRVRMEQARLLLETTDDIILSVALAVGYDDAANFSTAFRKYYGYSPSEIRKK